MNIEAHIPIEKITTPHPKRKQRCEVCQYFQSANLPDDNKNQGHCHRYAPRPCTTYNWSTVKGVSDWCGDFA